MPESLLSQLPIMLISGYSGSGKTTLIEKLIPELMAEGLTVAVIKHDTHGLNVDRPGKDSDRFFQAGATVIAHGPNEAFFRVPPARAWDLETAALHLLRSHDIVLVEGHKQTPIPAKIWLRSDSDEQPPPEARDAVLDLSRTAPRFELLCKFLRPWLDRQWLRTPVRAGILIGGRSSRMGRPKHLMLHESRSWLERVTSAVSEQVHSVAILGAGEVPESFDGWPRISDVPGGAGPLAGMRAAMRWDPFASWLFIACDMPLLTSEAISWLLELRAPARWAILPQRANSGQVEPLCAWYDFRAAPLVERLNAPCDLARWPHTHLAAIPIDAQRALDNINTEAEAAQVLNRT